MSTPYVAQTVAEIHQIIRDAIVNKRIIKGTYQGHAREMCPHVLGRNKQHQEQALFYQFGGSSSSGLSAAGSPNNWRCIPLAKLKDVSSEVGDWSTAPNHSRPQTCVAQIDVEVQF